MSNSDSKKLASLRAVGVSSLLGSIADGISEANRNNQTKMLEWINDFLFEETVEDDEGKTRTKVRMLNIEADDPTDPSKKIVMNVPFMVLLDVSNFAVTSASCSIAIDIKDSVTNKSSTDTEDSTKVEEVKGGRIEGGGWFKSGKYVYDSIDTMTGTVSMNRQGSTQRNFAATLNVNMSMADVGAPNGLKTLNDFLLEYAMTNFKNTVDKQTFDLKLNLNGNQDTPTTINADGTFSLSGLDITVPANHTLEIKSPNTDFDFNDIEEKTEVIAIPGNYTGESNGNFEEEIIFTLKKGNVVIVTLDKKFEFTKTA